MNGEGVAAQRSQPRGDGGFGTQSSLLNTYLNDSPVAAVRQHTADIISLRYVRHRTYDIPLARLPDVESLDPPGRSQLKAEVSSEVARSIRMEISDEAEAAVLYAIDRRESLVAKRATSELFEASGRAIVEELGVRFEQG